MSNIKRILIFVDWFDPGYKAGGPIQSCKYFALTMNESFSIFILTSDRDTGDLQPYQNISTDKWIDYDNNVKVHYISPAEQTIAKIGKLMEGIQPDYIYLNSLYSLKFTIFPLIILRKRNFKVPVVIAPRGMLHKGGMRFKTVKKKVFISALRFLGISKHLIFHATDEQEMLDTVHHFPDAKAVFLAENFKTRKKIAWKEVTKRKGELKLIYVSRIVGKKNLLFFLNILTQSTFNFQIIFDIVGEIQDVQYWKECENVIGTLPANINVTYLGAIPNEQVFSLYPSYHVFVLTTMGENFGHAIYEALLSGKPVLLSDQTPWTGLKTHKVGYDIPIDSPSEFIDALKHFAGMDQEEYNQWSHNAVRYVSEIENGKGLKEKYLQVFKPH